VADPEIVGMGMWSSGCGVGCVFSILDLKMASLGALWVLKSHALPPPLDPPLSVRSTSEVLAKLVEKGYVKQKIF